MSVLEEKSKPFQEKLHMAIAQVSKTSLNLQEKCFKCCVNCFSTFRGQFEPIGSCIQKCQMPADDVSQDVQREIHTLSSVLNDCQKLCFNESTSAFSLATSSEEKAAIEKKYDLCASQCLDKWFPEIDKMANRIKASINLAESKVNS